jgi:hypothetical protein
VAGSAGYTYACEQLAEAIANNDGYAIAYWEAEREYYFVLFNQVAMALTEFYIAQQNTYDSASPWHWWYVWLNEVVSPFNITWNTSL